MRRPEDIIEEAVDLAVGAAEDDVQRTLRDMSTAIVELNQRVVALEAEAMASIARHNSLRTDVSVLSAELRSNLNTLGENVTQIVRAARLVARSPDRKAAANLSGAFLGSASVTAMIKLAEYFHIIP